MSEVTGKITGITDVDPQRGTLAVTTAAADTSLVLDDVTDFEEAPGGWLRLPDGAVKQYATCDDDTETVTLAAGETVGAVYEVGVPVNVWDPDRGAEVIDYRVAVELDTGGVHPGVLLEHEQAVLAGVDNLTGAAVSLVPGDGDDEDWTVDHVYARETQLDLSTADPETAPDGLGGGAPTEPPAESPTLTTAGSKDSITVVAHGVVDPTTILDYYLDGVLMESTRSAVVVFRTDSAGNALQPDTEYVFHVVARNVIDEAAPSPTVTATLNPGVDSQTILDTVAAGFALLGSLDVGGITLKPPSGNLGDADYDSGGIIIPLTTGGEIRFPADGSPAIIEAILRTADLIVSGGLQLNGQTNYVNGTLFLGSGTPDPSAQPVLGSTLLTRDQLLLTAAGGNAHTGYDSHRGLAKAQNGRVAIISSRPNSSVKDFRVFDPANGWKEVGSTNSDEEILDFRSVACFGNTFYVLGQRWVSSAGESQLRIHRFDTNGDPLPGMNHWCEGTGGARITLVNYWDGSIAADTDGNPGTLLVAKVQSDGDISLLRYDAASDSPLAIDVRTIPGVNATVLHGGFYIGTGDFGAKRYAIQGTYDGTYQVKVFNPTTLVEDTPQSFSKGTWVGGLIFDAGVFKVMDYSTAGVALSHLRAGTTSAAANTVAVKHAWYDNNGVDGNKESAASPLATKVLPIREWPTIQVPPPPNTGSADNPANSIRLYLGPDEAGLKLHTTIEPAAGQTITTQRTVTPRVLVGAGADTPRAVSTFPQAASSGGVTSMASDASGPLTDLRGSGYARLIGTDPWHTVGAAGEPAFQNGWSPQSEAVQFRKTPTGDVHLRGRAKLGTAAASVFTLPVGYRPSVTLQAIAVAGGGDEPANIDITSAGTIIPTGLAAAGNVSLSGISFSTV